MGENGAEINIRREEEMLDVMQAFERLLDAKLDPLRKSVERLDKNYEKIVDIMGQQARYEEIVNNLQKDVEKANKNIDILYERNREMEKAGENKLWEITKIFITALIASGLTGFGLRAF